MPSVNEIKKKTKISIDEMYAPTEEPKTRKAGGSTIKNLQLDSQIEKKPEYYSTNEPVEIKNDFPTNQIAGQPENQLAEYKDNQLNKNQEPPFSSTQPNTFVTSKSQKSPFYKMTFNLTEDIYKAFNDLYAKRILQGRKTDKAELIAEAIRWLLKMEDNPS